MLNKELMSESKHYPVILHLILVSLGTIIYLTSL